MCGFFCVLVVQVQINSKLSFGHFITHCAIFISVDLLFCQIFLSSIFYSISLMFSYSLVKKNILRMFQNVKIYLFFYGRWTTSWEMHLVNRNVRELFNFAIFFVAMRCEKGTI